MYNVQATTIKTNVRTNEKLCCYEMSSTSFKLKPVVYDSRFRQPNSFFVFIHIMLNSYTVENFADSYLHIAHADRRTLACAICTLQTHIHYFRSVRWIEVKMQQPIGAALRMRFIGFFTHENLQFYCKQMLKQALKSNVDTQNDDDNTNKKPCRLSKCR